ncbi:MAG TPA: hypothetical protein PKK61_04185 [Defluviitaleaceae bacterium]|nr:hypothetical protein [Defluviitaleaceae bacterium]
MKEETDSKINEIFDCLEKELRLHEILNSERYCRGKSEQLTLVNRTVKLRLIIVRDKFEKFRKKFINNSHNALQGCTANEMAWSSTESKQIKAELKSGMTMGSSHALSTKNNEE